MRAMASSDPEPAGRVATPAPVLTRGFLFADLRGYTAFVESRGAAAGAELLVRYRALVREAVARHRGAEIKTEGDSFYLVFSSVSGAVDCALEIIADAAHANREAAAPIHVGIGVHAGETVETPDGYVGTAVNLAARLCAAASSGQVLVSQTVRDLTANTAGVRFEPAGRRRLKGIAQPVAVYRAAPTDSPYSQAHLRSALIRRFAIAVVGAVILSALVVFVATREPARLSGSGSTSSAAASPPSSAGIRVTGISIPPYIEGKPEPTPVALVPGIYQLTAFRPQITFTIASPGWMAVEDAPDTFDLEGTNHGYIIGALVQVVSTGPCVNSPTRLLDQTPHGLIEWLQAIPYLKVSNPQPVTAGGYAGLSVEISPGSALTRCSVGPPGVALFQVGDHLFSVRPTERVKVVTLDVGRQPVTLLVGALDLATYDRTVATAGPVIQSLKIAP
jgi:class 3 adenylate cyclase